MKKSKSQKTPTGKKSAGGKEIADDLSGKPDLPEDFLIVGIGASAGGIQALKEFFQNVPVDSGMAYVVILHLSPDHDSRLAEVLQQSAAIPVTQVKKRIRVAPDQVYVVPPNEHLTMTAAGDIEVTPNLSVEDRRAPVDIFFRTLAESHHARAVAVVLSGTGANGSMGIKRVKERGGAAFVQNPREAEFSEMSRNSIATDLVDRILNVADIPAHIIGYKQSLGTIVISDQAESRPEEQQQALHEIFTQLRVRTGHDFSNYKRVTVLRRIERRINVRGLENLPAYAVYLRQNPDETTALLKDLLISVTNFFRDREAFRFLETDVLPKIFHGKKADDQVRIWVAGCATGEEAYSMAMLCAERTNGGIDAPEVQIFASDIDERAIMTAREGLYTLNDAADVSPERLQSFFTKENEGYRVRRDLREMVLFANHNLLKDPAFSHLDAVTCRNMLIYLNPTAQERVMETFHFALDPGGFLFLGNSETVDGASDLYAPVSKEHRVYQSRHVSRRIIYPVADTSPSPSRRVRLDKTSALPALHIPPEQEDEQGTRAPGRMPFGDLHLRLLEQYAPSVVVNEEYDIVHMASGAARFLQMKTGEPTQNLLKLILPELRLELRTALYQAVERQTNVEIKNSKFVIDGRDETINIYVRPVPLASNDAARGFVLVLFEAARKNVDGTENGQTVYSSAEPVAGQLEEELTRTKTQLQTSSEQYEVQAEELKASNEELQAVNEELRSSAEELETSKEELQSVNEELVTVNQELKIKIEEITQTNNDFQNLINSTDIATIFLDRGFRVSTFTPAATRIFNLIAADRGRPLSDITHRLNDGNLLRDAETVLETLQEVERETRSTEGRVYSLRAMPYRTKDDKIGGVVLTFYDITERRQAEVAKSFLASIVESSEDSMLTTDFNGEITSWNKAAERLYGYAAEEAIGKPLTMLTLPEDLKQVLDNSEKIKRGEAVEIFDTIRLSKGGQELNLEVVLSPITDAAQKIIGFSTIARDVTERKRAEETIASDLKDTQTLQHLSARLLSETNIQTIYDEILTAAIAITRADAGTLQMLDADSQELVLFAHKNFKPKMRKRFERVGAGSKTACGIALRTGERAFVDFDAENANGANGSMRMHVEAGYLSAQSTPLIARSGDPVGMLNTHWRETKHRPSAREMRFLDFLARQAADLIEHYRTEQAMQKSEAKYRSLFDSIDEGFCTVEMIFDKNEKPVDYRFLEINPAFTKQTGIEAASGKRMREIAPHHEEHWFEIYGRVALTGESVRFENYAEALNRWYDVHASRVGGAEGRTVAIVFNDISGRKRMEKDLRDSEERLRLLIESVADHAIFTMTLDNRINIWNAGAEKVFGWTESEALGQSGELIFTPEDRAAGAPEQEIEIALEKGRAPDERFHLRKDGSRFYASGVMTLLKDKDGKIQGFAKIARDMTEQVEAERALRDKEMLQKLIGAQEEERKRIARDLHDELGQQLTALRLKLDAAQKMCGDNDELGSKLGEIELIAKGIDKGVDFLAWELRPAALDDLGLVAALDNYVRQWSHHSGVMAELITSNLKKARFAPEIETNIYRIVQEALNNTHKHAKAKRAEVVIEKRDNLIVVLVEDDGKGFNPKDKRNKSKGIGLIGMRERAQLVGGTLEIESAPGHGTTVFVRVPAATFKREKSDGK